MRNLKKVFAVILTIAMFATMMVTAFASVSYYDEAVKLQNIGLFAGTPADLKLEESVTRIQGLAFAIRAAGKEAEAFAMTDEEVAEILADWTDADEIPAWGKKYAAYAIKNEITLGVSSEQKIFAPLVGISGTSFLVFLMKSGMGYADVTTANVADVAMEAGVLTAAQAALYAVKAELIRDDAAAILYGAAMNGVNADGKTFIQSLIDAEFVDVEDAIANGFYEDPTLAVESVTATNLKQLIVKFNREIKSAGNEDNYELETDGDAVLDENSDFDLQDDKKTVIITLTNDAAQQEVVDLTIKDIETEDGQKLEEVTFEDVELFDTTIPSALSASVVGNDTIKVVFSEPIETISEDDFTIDDGEIIVDTVTMVSNNTEANVKLFATLDSGTLKVDVASSVKDYAGFGIPKASFTVKVVKDEAAPVVVGYKDATPTGVTLIFDEDIKIVDGDAANFYHTNDSGANIIADPITDGTIIGKELTLDFSTNNLPKGTAYVYIAKDAISDLWDNKNSKISYKIEVELDTTLPTIEKVEQVSNAEDEIKITFSEKLDTDSAQEIDNYTLLDKDGKTLADKISSALYDGDKAVTITFAEDLSGDYSIVVENVEDLAGNKIAKVAKSFTIKDISVPDFEDFTAKLYDAGGSKQTIRVNFGEAMAVSGPYSVVDLDKYMVNGILLSDVDDAEIKAVNDNKAVEIKVPCEPEDGDPSDPADGIDLEPTTNGFIMARVADAAGNKTEKLASDPGDIKLVGEGTVGIDSAELTNKNTIVVTLTDRLTTFKASDFSITTDGSVAIACSRVRHTINDDGNSVVTFTLVDEIGTTTESGIKVVTVTSSAIQSKNTYGEKLVAGADVGIADKAAPVVVEVEFLTSTAIKVTFSEEIDESTVASGKNGFSVNGGTLNAAVQDTDDKAVFILQGEKFTVNTDVSYNKVFGLADAHGNEIDSFNRTDKLTN